MIFRILIGFNQIQPGGIDSIHEHIIHTCNGISKMEKTIVQVLQYLTKFQISNDANLKFCQMSHNLYDQSKSTHLHCTSWKSEQIIMFLYKLFQF